MEISLIISMIAILISIFALLFTYLQMRWSSRNKLFTGFELANQMTIENPSILKHVHGLPEDYSNEELQSIAYLSLIIDSYQHFYADMISNNYNRLQNDCIKSSTLLNNILIKSQLILSNEFTYSLTFSEFSKSSMSFLSILKVAIGFKPHVFSISSNAVILLSTPHV